MNEKPQRLIAVMQHARCAKCQRFPCAVFMVKGKGLCASCTKKALKNVELYVEPTAIDEVLKWNSKRGDER